MDTFRTTGPYSKKMLFLGALSPIRLIHKILYSCCVLLAISAIILAYVWQYPPYMMMGILLLIVSPLPLVRAWQYTRITLKRLGELSSNTHITSFFEEDGLHVIGVNGHENTLPYSVIRFARIYKNYIILVSKARQYAVVFRNELSPERQKALLEYLRQKNIRIHGRLK